MILIAKTVLAILFIFVAILTYLLYRNERVLRFRLKILEKDIELYYKLPSYDSMLYSLKPLREEFWIE